MSTPPSGDHTTGDKPQMTVPPFNADEFKKRLTDEYRILQEKIDKIGGFRFTIKGWSVTAVIAASAAATRSNSFSTVLVISAGLVVMLCFFFHFELEQVKLSRLFGDRARKLEDGFRLVDRGSQIALQLTPVPYMAHEIVQMSFHRRMSPPRGAKARWKQWLDRWRIRRQAHFLFYAVLILMALLILIVPYHSEIRTRWENWSGKTGSSAVHKYQPGLAVLR